MAIFEFTAIRGDVLSQNPLDVGGAFTMPLGDRVTLTVSDNDTILAGDLFLNEVGDDGSQILLDDGSGRGGVRVYAERRLVVQDAQGQQFTLIEIEQQGGGDVQSSRFYTFVGAAPNQNVALTVISSSNAIGNVATFADLGAGVSFEPNAAGEIIVEAEDLQLNGYVTALDGGASGGEVIAVAGATGEASIIFGGATENYTILVDLVDAVNGASEVALFVNGELVTSAVLDFADGETGGLQRLTVAAPDRVLAEGDLIEILGTSDGADSAIVDRVVFLVNGAPEANPDLAGVLEDFDITVDVLANDVDGDGEQLFVVEAGGQPAGETATVESVGGRFGLLDVNADGLLVFRTNDGFDDLGENETDLVIADYTIVDESGGIASSTLTIEVVGVNDAPDVEDFVGQTNEDETLAGQLVALDVEGDQLTFSLNGAAANGAVTVNADGSFTYDPDQDFNGQDVFSFEVFDGTDTVLATATIDVTPVNDAPEIDEGNSDLSFEFFEEEVAGPGGQNLRSCMSPMSIMSGSYGAGHPGWLSATAPGAPSQVVDASGASAALTQQPVAGTIFFADPDVGDQHIIEVVGVVSFGDNGAFDAVDLASLLVVDNIDSAGGEINYTFTADTALIDAFNGFGEGEVAEISFTVRVTDDGDPELFDETVVSVTLIGLNDAPVAPPAFFNGVEDEAVTGQLIANDAEGDALTFALATDAQSGTVEIFADGSFIYNPAPDFNGTDTFTFTVTDGAETITQFGTIFVDPVNDAPVAVADFVETDEDSQVSGNVIVGPSGPDFDIDGDTLTVVAVEGQALVSGQTITLSSGALLTMNDDGFFVYNPIGQFDGTDEGDNESDAFTYTISDGLLTSQATVDIEIIGVNDAPVGVADAFTTGEDDLVDENLLANDEDVDGIFLEVVDGGDVVLGQPLVLATDGGRTAFVDVLADGSVFFDAFGEFNDLAKGETDTFSFTYVARDADGAETDATTVTITVEGENDAPEIDVESLDQTIALDEDDSVNGADVDGFVRGSGFIDFFDPDIGDTHTLTVDDVTVLGAPIAGFDALGAITVNSVVEGVADFTFAIDDALLQTLGAGEAASFVYDLSITDDEAVNPLSDTTTFTVELFGVNDAPVADDLSISGDEDTDISGALTAVDVDGDAVTFSDSGQPANGSVVINGDGSFTYTPDENFNGTDTFTFVVDDGLDIGVGTVTVTVDPVNDPAQAIAPDFIAATTILTTGTASGGIDNTNDGAQHAIGALNGGGFVTIDRQAAGQGTAINIFDATGTEINETLTSEVNDSSSDGGQDVAVLNNGNLVTVWVEARDTLLIRRFNPDGTAAGVEFVGDDNNSSFIDGTASVASMSDGGFVVAWRGFVNDPQEGLVGQVFARRFDANGNEVQGTTRVDNLAGENANAINVVGLDNGGFAVPFFVDNLGGGRSLQLSVFDATGFAVARGIIVDDPVELGNGVRPSATQLTNGDIVVAYEALSGDNVVTPFIAIFSETGISQGPPIQVVDFTGNSTDGQRDPSVVALPDGGFVVAFANDRFPQTNNETGETFASGVVVQQFDATGVAVGEPEFIQGGSKPQAVLTENGTVAVAVLGADNNSTQIFEIELANNPFIVAEEGSFDLGLLSVADIDGDDVTATLQSDNATFFFDSPGAVVITGAGTNFVTISGTVAEVNAAIAEAFYQPNANFSGDDDLTFSVTDNDAGGAVVDTQVIPFIVTGVNDAPTANDAFVSGDEDTDITGTIIANDPDGDALTFSVAFEGDFLTTVIDPSTGAFTITPDENFNGADTANILVEDGRGGSVAVTIDVTVNPVNDAPVANDDTAATDQDTPVGANLLQGPGGDFDPDFNGLTITEINGVAITDGEIVTLPSGALITIGTDGEYSYDPNDQFDNLANGVTADDVITYTVTDGQLSDQGQLTVTITGLNDAPAAANDAFAALESDASVTENVIANDVDVDGDLLTIVDFAGDVNLSETVTIGTSGGRSASFNMNSDGDLTFNIAGGFEDLGEGETDTVDFNYVVQDGSGLQSAAVATFTITGVNDAPVAQNDAFNVLEDTGLSGDLFVDNGSGLDEDIDGALNIGAVNSVAANVGQVVTLASGALLTVNADGSFDYDQNGAFDALNIFEQDTETFTYTLDDGFATSTATVTITIDGVNDAPVAVNDSVALSETLVGGGGSFNVLTNDVDPESQTLELVDGGGDVTLSDTFLITSAGGRDAEFSANVSGLISINTTAFEDLGEGETDTVTFTYEAQDTEGAFSDPATVTLTITGENDPVSSSGDASAFVDEDATNATDTVTFTEVDANDFVTLTLISSTSVGDETSGFASFDFDAALSIIDVGEAFDLDFAIDQTLVDPLGEGQFASIVFDLELSDGTVTEALTFTVNIQGLNDNPVADSVAVTTDEDVAVSGTVTAIDVDETDAIDFTLQNAATNGVAVVNLDGTFTYTPNADFAGTDTFDVRAEDGVGGFDISTVTVTVNPINDAPTAAGALTAAQFDTTNSLQNTTSGGVGLNSAFTVEMWITADNVGTLSTLYSEDQLGVDTTGAIGINLLANGGIEFEVNNVDVLQTAAGLITNGVPAHVSVTHDSTVGAGSDNTFIYINGQEVAAGEIVSPTASTNVLVGRRGLGDNFSGDIGELRLFDVALSGGDVQDGFDNQALVGDAGLVHYFAFNEADGDAFDLTGNGLTLTAVGDGVPRVRSDAPISVNRLAVEEDAGPATISILVDDVDSAASDVDVILTATDGFITITNPGSLNIIGNGLGQVTLIGPVADINAALALLTYEAPSNFSGSTSIQIDIADQGANGAGGNLTATDTILIEVLPVNDAPVADNAVVSGDEDQVISGTLTANDVDGDALTFVLDTEGANGTTVINPDGTFTYTPDENFNGIDQVFFTVDDGNGGTDLGFINVTIDPVNDTPEVTANGALRFDGTDTQRVDVAHNALLSPATDFTVEAVISTTDDTAGLHRVLRKGVGGGQTYSITVEDGDAIFRIDNGSQGFAINGGSVADGLVHTISVTVEGPTNIVTVYVDGVETATQTIGGTILQGTEALQIGSVTAAANQDFEGDIHEIRFFNEVRDEATIAANDDQVLDPANEDALQLYLTFEGNVVDSSGNDFNGAITGAPEFVEGAAPQNGALIAFEDTPIELNNVNLNDVEIDFDNETGLIRLTISVRDGILTFNQIGLVDTINSGANDSDAISVSIQANNALQFIQDITYTPDPDFNGVDLFSVTINDQNIGGGNTGPRSDTLQQNILVSAVNDAPLADDLAVSGDEDTNINGTVVANDVDGDALTFSLDSDGLNGAAVVNSDGTFTYTPNADFNGTDTFTYFVEDGNGGDDVGLVTVTVDPVNDAPVVTHSSAGFFSGSTANFGELTPFNDIPPTTLTISVFARADSINAVNHIFTYGDAGDVDTLFMRFNADGAVVFAFNGAGPVSAPLNVFDGAFHHVVGTIDTVTGDMELFVDDVSVAIATGTPGFPIPTGGTLILGHDQDSPGGGFDASQSFIGDLADFVVIDGFADAATVADLGSGIVDLSDPNTILVGQFDEPEGAFVDATGNGNDITINGTIPRVAGPDGLTITLLEDETVGVSVGVVDVDVADGADELEVTVSVTEGIFDFGGLGSVTVTAGADGSKDVTFNGATADVQALLDSFTYIPASDFNGTDTIEITVSDLGNTGAGGVQVTALNIPVIVSPVNDPPVAQNDAAAGNEGTSFGVGLLANDSDPEGELLQLVEDANFNFSAAVTHTTVGGRSVNLSSDANGNTTLTAFGIEDIAAGDSDTLTLTYTVEDASGAQSTADVTYTINGENDAPVAQNDLFFVNEDEVLSDSVFGDNGNGADEDVDGDNFTVTLVDGSGGVGVEVSLPSGALLTLNSDGTFVYDQNGAFNDLPDGGGGVVDSFTYTISDGTLTDQATVEIDVFGQNDAPIANDDAFAINEDDGPQTDNVLANDIDVDAGDILQVREGGGTVDLTNTFTITSAGGRNADFDIDAAGDITINLNGNFEDLADGITDTITLTYEIEDGVGEISNLGTIVYTVTGENDAPTATEIDEGQFGEDDNPAPIDLLATANDADGEGLTVDAATLTATNDSGDAFTFDLSGSVFTLDGGQFESLAVGEIDAVTVTYDITDGNIISDNAGGAQNVPNAGRFFLFNFDTNTSVTVERAGGINTVADAAADQGILNGFGVVVNPGTDFVSFGGSTFENGIELVRSLDEFEIANYAGGVDDFGTFFNLIDDITNGTVTMRAINVATPNGEQLVTASISGIDFTDGIGNADLGSIDFTVESTFTNTAVFDVTGANDNPTANDDTATTDEDTAVIIDLLGNDVDPDTSDFLSIFGAITPDNGSVVDNGDGTITYTPDADFFGVDTFTYEVTDGNGGVDTGSITVTVNSVTDPVPAVAMSTVQGGGNNTGFVINGIASGDQSGVSVSDAGDVNGDGLDDVIVGAYFADGAAGQTYVVFGKADGAVVDLTDIDQASGVGGFAIDGGGINPRSGFSVDGAADVNGDGLDDLLISSYQEGPNGAGSGQAFVVFGKSGDTDRVDLGALGVGEGFAINGAAADEFAGFSVSTISDVNGDGLDDLIVSSAFADIGGAADAGRVHVVFGKADDADIELSAIVPTAGLGFEIIGEQANEQFGNKVSNAGDFNNDGIEDLIIGAPNFDGGGGAEGRAFIVFGKADDAQVDVVDIVAGVGGGIALDAAAIGDDLGVSVSDAGDFNGDGIDDIIVGANGVATNGADAGAAYIIFGRAGGALTPIDLGSLGAADGIVINGADAGDNIGTSVSSAGDVNGDGFEDVIIGGSGIDTAGGNTGGAFVVFGTSSTATIELSGIEAGGAGGFLIEGVDAGDFTGGNSVSGGGDINGDGFDDLIIGAKNADPGGNTAAGETTVIFGGELIGANDANIVGDAAANVLSGSDDFNDLIIGGAGDDTIDGGGGDDILSGGAGSDIFIFNDGDGNNVIRGFGDFSDPGQDEVDIGDFNFLDFAGVEAAMTQEGLNTRLQLDVDDSILFLDRDLDSFVASEFDLGGA